MVIALDKVGTFCLDALSHISDNMGLMIALMTALFGVIWGLFLLKCRRIPALPLEPVSMLFALWIQYLIDRMPMIHNRMHLALSTTAGLIQISTDYLEPFVEKSGLSGEKSSEIASFLYSMTEAERRAWKCNPQDLYTHLFNTMDKIRSMWIFPDVHESLWGTWAMILPILLIVFMVFAATEQKNGKLQKGSLCWLAVQILFTGYAAWHSMGMFLCVALLWITETMLLALRQEKAEEKKMVPGSEFTKKR